MTPSDLKYHVELAGNEPHFFDRKTMRFFGDSMRNYGCRLATVSSDYDPAGNYYPNGIKVPCYELYRKHPVKHGLQQSAFFCRATFKQIFPRG